MAVGRYEVFLRFSVDVDDVRHDHQTEPFPDVPGGMRRQEIMFVLYTKHCVCILRLLTLPDCLLAVPSLAVASQPRQS